MGEKEKQIDKIKVCADCCSNECPRHQSCARWYGNKTADSIPCYNTEAWYTFGGGTIDQNGIHNTWNACGENGNWARFVPIESPAVDVVEVVRCKDCCWWHTAGCAFRPDAWPKLPGADDYCSHGERR